VTGNHSVFGVDANGDTQELKAGELGSGDTLLTPRTLPSTDRTVEEINLLEHVDRGAFSDRRVYVYGFDRETLKQLQTEETIRRRPSDESDRKRTYYRYDGVEILKDSLDQNYLEKGYLPAETVLELGWEERAADCEFKTYRVGGDETTLPVSLPVDESLVEMLAYYVSEGHAGPRQVGFTFGSHESDLIEATEQAVQTLGGATTTVERERNSTRIKAFGSPLALFLKSVCGDAARNKRVPEFVFDLDPERSTRETGPIRTRATNCLTRREARRWLGRSRRSGTCRASSRVRRFQKTATGTVTVFPRSIGRRCTGLISIPSMRSKVRNHREHSSTSESRPRYLTRFASANPILRRCPIRFPDC
jgi:DNA topoisomerase-6 subunit B